MPAQTVLQMRSLWTAGALRPAIAAIVSIAAVIAAPSAASAQAGPPGPEEFVAERTSGDRDEDYAAGVALVVRRQFDGSAQASAVAEQSTVGGAAYLPSEDARVAITSAVNNTVGVIGINQEAGAGNIQGNVVAIALDGAAGTSAALADIHGSQLLRDNIVVDGGGDRVNVIVDSFNHTSGIAQVSQATGAFNQHLHVAAIALGGVEGVGAAQVDDAALAGVRNQDGNAVDYAAEAGARAGGIENSFNGFTGLAQVSQTAGNLNQVSQTIGIGIGGAGG